MVHTRNTVRTLRGWLLALYAVLGEIETANLKTIHGMLTRAVEAVEHEIASRSASRRTPPL